MTAETLRPWVGRLRSRPGSARALTTDDRERLRNSNARLRAAPRRPLHCRPSARSAVNGWLGKLPWCSSLQPAGGVRQVLVRVRWAPQKLSGAWGGTAGLAAPVRSHCTVVFRVGTVVVDVVGVVRAALLEQVRDLGGSVAAVPAEGADRVKFARVGHRATVLD